MAVTINASTTTGLVTSADTSGNLDLQAGGVTKIAVTSAGANIVGTLTVNGVAPASGKVLQVVNAVYSTEVGNNTTTPIDTNLTATITPTSSTSKILVFANIGAIGGHLTTGVYLTLVKASTTLYTFAANTGYVATVNSDNIQAGSCITYLDSPATTSATTYKVQFRAANTSYTVYANYNNATSSITLMEIAA